MLTACGTSSSENVANGVSAICKDQWDIIRPVSDEADRIQESNIAKKWVDPFEKFLKKAQEQMESILQSRPAVKPIAIRKLHKPSVKTCGGQSLSSATIAPKTASITSNEPVVLNQPFSSPTVAPKTGTTTPNEQASSTIESAVSSDTEPAVITTEESAIPCVKTSVTSNLNCESSSSITQIEYPPITSECLIVQNPSLQNTPCAVETITLYSCHQSSSSINLPFVGKHSNLIPPISQPIAHPMKSLQKNTVRKKTEGNKKVSLQLKRKKMTKCQVLLIDYYKMFGNCRMFGEGFGRSESKSKKCHKLNSKDPLSADVNFKEIQSKITGNKQTGKAKEKRKQEDVEEPSLKKCKRKEPQDPTAEKVSGKVRMEVEKLFGEAHNKENIGVEAVPFMTLGSKSSESVCTSSPSNEKTDKVVSASSPQILPIDHTHKDPNFQLIDTIKSTISQVVEVSKKCHQLEPLVVEEATRCVELRPQKLLDDNQSSMNTRTATTNSSSGISSYKKDYTVDKCSTKNGHISPISEQLAELVSSSITSNKLKNDGPKPNRQNNEELSVFRCSELYLIDIQTYKSLREKPMQPAVTALPIDTIPIAEFDAANMSVKTYNKSLQRRENNLSLNSVKLWKDFTCFACLKTFPNYAEWNHHVKLPDCHRDTVLIK